ncbi:MAG TPA: EamA family transporter [Clostridiaceae bacterium]|nr:EamA family transporter [Clostridiaceae bacterium]
MFNYIWPIALVILSNVIYQICAKSVPNSMNPLASLTITYTVSAVISLILFFLLNKDLSIISEFKKINWAPFAFGIVLVGLEIGWIYAYRAGWQVSTAQIVQSAFLAVALIFVGTLLYKEILSWNKIVGVVICLIGLVFINYE